MAEGSRVVEILMHIAVYLHISHKHQVLHVWSRMPHSSSQELYPICHPEIFQVNTESRLVFSCSTLWQTEHESQTPSPAEDHSKQYCRFHGQHRTNKTACSVQMHFSSAPLLSSELRKWCHWCQCCFVIPVVCGTCNDCLGFFISVFKTQEIRTTKLWQLLLQGELFCCNMNVTSELRNRPWKIQLTKHFKPIFANTVM